MQHEVLLPLSTMGIHVLAKFLDLSNQLNPLAPVVADASSGLQRSTVETQVLELTTVAEGLHRSIYTEDLRLSPEEAERIRGSVTTALASEPERHTKIVQGLLQHLESPNYKTRLNRLASVAETLMPGVSGNKNEWVKRVDKARNAFAHRAQGPLSREDVDEYYAISQSMRWVLIAVFLVNSGVSVEDCSARIQENSRYRQFLRNMNSSLPSVFVTQH